MNLSKQQIELAKYLRENPIKGAEVTKNGGLKRCPKSVWAKIKLKWSKQG